MLDLLVEMVEENATLITQLTNKCYHLLVGVLLDKASQINLEEWA